jgi:hypothetical protein
MLRLGQAARAARVVRRLKQHELDVVCVHAVAPDAHEARKKYGARQATNATQDDMPFVNIQTSVASTKLHDAMQAPEHPACCYD